MDYLDGSKVIMRSIYKGSGKVRVRDRRWKDGRRSHTLEDATLLSSKMESVKASGLQKLEDARK